MKNSANKKATPLISEKAFSHLLSQLHKTISNEELISSKKTGGLEAVSRSHQNDFLKTNPALNHLCKLATNNASLDKKYSGFIKWINANKDFNEYDLVIAVNNIYGL